MPQDLSSNNEGSGLSSDRMRTMANELGRECELAEDFGHALALYELAAEHGDGSAMRKLAQWYENGFVVEQNSAESAKWWRKAAEYNSELFVDDFRNAHPDGSPYFPDQIFKHIEETLPGNEAEEEKEKLSHIYARLQDAEMSGNDKEFVFASGDLLSNVMRVEGRMGELTQSAEEHNESQERRPGGGSNVLTYGRKLLVWVAAAVVIIGFSYKFLKRELHRPHLLTRFTAAQAIESSAQFQHKTKLFFEINEAEGALPGACHNFKVSPKKMHILFHYLETGAMKFLPYRNQVPPFAPRSIGSLDLSLPSTDFLTDNIDSCKEGEVNQTTGAYELTLGNPVVKVNGIREEGGRTFVDFTWHFESLNEVGAALPRIVWAREMESAEEHLTQEEKSNAPFWTGRAELLKYDDGWRIVTLKLSSSGFSWDDWEYGPNWPDPLFNWDCFDENENHY